MINLLRELDQRREEIMYPGAENLASNFNHISVLSSLFPYKNYLAKRLENGRHQGIYLPTTMSLRNKMSKSKLKGEFIFLSFAI